jgi:hypothetical protein
MKQRDAPILRSDLLDQEPHRHPSNPQRRANGYGHAALLTQSLENPAGLPHAHTRRLRRGVAPCSPGYIQNKNPKPIHDSVIFRVVRSAGCRCNLS